MVSTGCRVDAGAAGPVRATQKHADGVKLVNGPPPHSVPGSWMSPPGSHAAEASANRGDRRAKCHEKRGTKQPECLLDRDAGDVPAGQAEAHWKISVVQSPPCSRTSWARAGPSARSWKSTKKPGSTSIPPSGEQFTLKSQERSPG